MTNRISEYFPLLQPETSTLPESAFRAAIEKSDSLEMLGPGFANTQLPPGCNPLDPKVLKEAMRTYRKICDDCEQRPATWELPAQMLIWGIAAGIVIATVFGRFIR